MVYLTFKKWIRYDKIEWSLLCLNPNAIDFLMKNQDKIFWSYLSTNPNAIELIKANPEKIYWDKIGRAHV